jgi:hypothetical protein
MTNGLMDADQAKKLARATLAVASQDQDFARFGAHAHRYRFAPPLAAARLRAIEKAHGVRIPEDYATFVTTVGAAGAGPFYGLLPLDTPSQLSTLAGELGTEDLAGAFALCHMGCTYVALLVVAGPRRGEVWADFRSVGAGFRPLYPSFSHLYEHWLEVMAAPDQTLDTSLPPVACGLPGLIDKVIVDYATANHKQLEACTEDDARAALGRIPDGAIAFRAAGPTTRHYFDEGDPVDVCPSCRRLADHFIARGAMRGAQIVPGAPPRIRRESGASA